MCLILLKAQKCTWDDPSPFLSFFDLLPPGSLILLSKGIGKREHFKAKLIWSLNQLVFWVVLHPDENQKGQFVSPSVSWLCSWRASKPVPDVLSACAGGKGNWASWEAECFCFGPVFKKIFFYSTHLQFMSCLGAS